MGHVYVTACGYSKRVVPASSPYEFNIAPDGSLRLVLTAVQPFAVRQVTPDAELDLDPGQHPIADVIPGAAASEWWLDCQAYRVPLPQHWTAVVSGEVSPAFDLVQEPQRAVFVQTARNRPKLSSLVFPGQTVTAEGSEERADWIELSYVHDGNSWVQRHALMRTKSPALITAQAPEPAFAAARALHADLVRRVVFDE